MKIGFVLDDTLDTSDGVQQYVLGLGGWLEQQGHEVHYLVGLTTRTDRSNIHSLSRNIKVRFNGNRMSMPLPAPRRAIRQLLKAERFDILHVQMPYSPLMAHRIIVAAPKTTAVVGTFHIAPNSGLVAAATRALAMWTRRSLERMNVILAVSQAAADFARQTYHVSSLILPNVVDVNRFASARPYDQYAKMPTIVFLGRLVERKGCGLLLQAVKLLREIDPGLSFQVVICGKGPLGEQLQTYAREHKLDDIVSFTGFASEIDKVRYLKSADIAVFPSSGGESFGIVLLEAMAAGRPVVLGAANPGYATVLAPYEELLFPVGDSTALASTLRKYLTDQPARKRALEWQRSYIPRFDTAVVGRQLLRTYRDAIERLNAS